MENVFRNLILLTIEAFLMLVFGIVVTIFGIGGDKTPSEIKWGWVITGGSIVIVAVSLTAALIVRKKIRSQSNKKR